MNTPPSDSELIKQACKGDKYAFQEIFNRYRRKVMNFLYRYIGDYQKAEDVTIETFLEVYRILPRYREEGKFLPWLFKIAINFSKKEFRRLKKRHEVTLEKKNDEKGDAGRSIPISDNSYRPDTLLLAKELEELLEKSIAKLDDKYKSVLLLCDVQGLSYEEAALVLRCDKNTIGVRLSRARALLQAMLKNHGYAL